MQVVLNGLSFECRLDGRAEAPWLVFSNSVMTNHEMWDAQVAVLDSRFRILRYDQRGHGRTAVPAAPSTFDELTSDLRALLDHFGIERAVLVGVSMGGVTALQLASQEPHRVAGVVAADCQWIAPATAVTAWDDRVALARRSGMEALVEPTVQRWFTAAFLATAPAATDRVRQMIRTTPVEGFVACARALQHYDIRDPLRRIRCPVQFIVGAQDGVMPPVMRQMHEAVPGSAWLSIDDAGHLPPIEQPEMFGAAVEQFCAGLAASRR